MDMQAGELSHNAFVVPRKNVEQPFMPTGCGCGGNKIPGMPLDDALTTRMADPDFWQAYLFEADAPETEGSYQARFEVGAGFALTLDVNLAHCSFDLALVAPDLPKPAELGWDDLAHFHPHVLRWAELDLLARACALQDPELRHPGLVVALLMRFVVLDDQDDLDAITPMVDAAFRSVRPREGDGVRAETRNWFETRDLRGTGLRWTRRPDGHEAVMQSDAQVLLPLYSLRTPESTDFPFPEWAALLAQAESVVAADHPVLRAVAASSSPAESCWATEVLTGVPRGTLVPQWFGRSALADARYWDLDLTTRHRQVVADLTAALGAAGLGRAEESGSTDVRDEHGRYRYAMLRVEVRVRDDLEAGVAVISDVLRRHGTVDTATLHYAAEPRDPIALT